jgi:hypothetical protein
MPNIPARWAQEPETHDRNLKGILLLALTVAILTFCATVFVR